MAHRWNYSGDMNLTEGGFYWREDDADDYVLAVDVTPCADAGGPSNLFHIESGSIFLPVDDLVRLRDALSCCGWDVDDAGNIVGNGADAARKGSREWRWRVVEACKAYHGLDRGVWGGCTVVQIGPAEEDAWTRGGGWSPEPDVVLRGNAKLENYVRREFLA